MTLGVEVGKYSYKPLNPGSYDIVVIESGHQTQPVNKIKIIPNEATYVDVKMTPNTLGTVTVVAKAYDYTKPLKLLLMALHWFC